MSDHIQKPTVQEFRAFMYAFYSQNKRAFAWRYIDNPYLILVSEIMLQQTQTDRVSQKFEAFIEEFPTIGDLAHASLLDVMKAWQGLGYNRRAKFLHQAAQVLYTHYNSIIPSNPDELRNLPGVGAYTSCSVATFAYNVPTVFIETNIRAVFIRHFFDNQEKVHDKEIMPLIEEYLDTQNPRSWYYALMDYGSFLKKQISNPNHKSTHYTVQSKFEGSDRQIRGAIVRFLTKHSSITHDQLHTIANTTPDRIQKIIEKLIAEGLVKKEDNHYAL